MLDFQKAISSSGVILPRIIGKYISGFACIVNCDKYTELLWLNFLVVTMVFLHLKMAAMAPGTLAVRAPASEIH
jgi:hypothetical protein